MQNILTTKPLLPPRFHLRTYFDEDDDPDRFLPKQIGSCLTCLFFAAKVRPHSLQISTSLAARGRAFSSFRLASTSSLRRFSNSNTLVFTVCISTAFASSGFRFVTCPTAQQSVYYTRRRRRQIT